VQDLQKTNEESKAAPMSKRKLRRAAMQPLTMKIAIAAKTAWWWLRQVLGDAAYENYLRSTSSRASRTAVIPSEARNPSCTSATAHVLTREEFYLDALRRRYSSISRCC
jgi:uncharacterized short protein YbdD (DUF466 family)